MNRWSMVPVIVCLACAGVLAQRSVPEEIVLDYDKAPEQFPEWFIWENFFMGLRQGARPGPSDRKGRVLPPHERLGVSEVEFQLVLKEADDFYRRRDQLAKSIDQTYTRLEAEKKSEEQIRDQTDQINLEYRYRILDARERLLTRLSPESAQHLRSAAVAQMRGTTIHLRGRARETFRLPW